MTDTGILFEAVYAELKRIAEGRLRVLPPGRSLHATVLVHEAFIRLMGSRKIVSDEIETVEDYKAISPFVKQTKASQLWSDRAAFFAASSEAMRRIIIDHYRSKVSQKRGGGFRRIPIEPGHLPCPTKGRDLLEIEGALQAFEAAFPEKAKVVKLRFFLGMTMPEAADALGTSLATAERHWRYARAWIAEFLEKS
ncbi:MAG: ECF-type sigma factor [Pirellula sp.]|jgi:hypothetical protein